MRAAVAGPISDYHELLEKKYFADTASRLEDAIRQDQLSVAGRPICSVLRPQFLDEPAYRMVIRASSLVMQGFRELAQRLLIDGSLRKWVGLTPEEDELVLIDTGYGSADVSARLDGFLDSDDHFRFVEYNADSPGGIAFGDALADAFNGMELLREFARKHPYRTIPTRAKTFDTLLSTYQAWGGSGLPSIAIVDWKTTPTRNEFELMKRHFEERGCQVRIVDPEALEYSGGRLFADGMRVDLVYKRIVVFELLERLGIHHPLVRAVRDRAVCMANGFAVQMLFQKSLFAMLSDPDLFRVSDPEVMNALQAHLPWSRLVRETQTQRGTERVDLLMYIAENKDSLVVKPCREYGGKGVNLGWECSDAEWESAIQTALTTPHIVQERVTLGAETYPSISDGKLVFDQRYFDLDPYIWKGHEVEGCGVRLSRGALLNVSAGGGSATPLMILREST